MDNEIKISWTGVFRMFLVGYKVVNAGGILADIDIRIYKSLFEQLNDSQKEYIVSTFGESLTFLNELTGGF